MDRGATRVLLIEDDPGDAALVRRDLGKGERAQFQLHHVLALQAGFDQLDKSDVDVVLLDLNLPDSTGVETVLRLREHDPRVPIVVFTVAGDEDTAVAALDAGAQDYLVKDELGGSLLRRSIRYAIERRRIAEENDCLQRRLHEAEKMESLGALSAGIAFGFNNLLGTILDRCDSARAELHAHNAKERLPKALTEIHRAAFRAAEMVAQLRDYASLEPGKPIQLDLSRFVLEASQFLDSIVTPDVELAYDVSGDVHLVRIGRLELHRVLLSLVLNAAEAIGKQPGSISISTGTLEADESFLAESHGWPHPQPGAYAFLRVTDGGRGIDAARKDRIFDPFYSTKFAGRGLGLASVLGILRNHRAVVRVDSRRPTGTVFTILFPARTSDLQAGREGSPLRRRAAIRLA
jgi:signal transduction histidine kinase